MTESLPKRGRKPLGTPEERAARRAQQVRDSQAKRRQKFIGHVVQLSSEEDALIAQLVGDSPGGKKGWIEAVLRAELAKHRAGKRGGDSGE